MGIINGMDEKAWLAYLKQHKTIPPRIERPLPQVRPTAPQVQAPAAIPAPAAPTVATPTDPTAPKIEHGNKSTFVLPGGRETMTPPDYIRSNPPELVSKFSDLSSPNTAGAADAAKESEAVLHEGEEVFAAYADMPPGCVECPLHDMPAHEKQIAQAMGFADTCESLADKPNKCPPGGCVQPTDGKFKVISGRTGKAWPSKFGSEKKAKAAIAAWHIKAGH